MTEEELRKIEARAKAAGDEKWEVVTCGDGRLFIGTPGDIVCHCDPNHEQPDEWDQKNFAFIASAREDIPPLIAALREAWQERDEQCALVAKYIIDRDNAREDRQNVVEMRLVLTFAEEAKAALIAAAKARQSPAPSEARAPEGWRDIAAARAAGVREEREAILKIIAKQIADFQSEQYAIPQPMGSFSEVFACNTIASAIRARETGGGE